MTEAQAFARLHRLTPAGAVAYLTARGQVTQTFSWQDLWQDEHALQFTVSRLARADLLADLQRMIGESVAGDMSRRDFARDARALLTDAGWWGDKEVLDPVTGRMVATRFDPARLKLIFDTNTRQAYAAGQWERIQKTKRTMPYLRYVTSRDDRVREAHRNWDNVTLPVDDAFWRTHMPPNGWRCRCRVVAVNLRDYERGTTPTGAPMRKYQPALGEREWVNQRTGSVERVPLGIDPGFGYNAGLARAAAMHKTVQEKGEALPAALASGMLSDQARGAAFAAWLQEPKGMWPLARLPIEDAELLQAKARVAVLSDATAIKQKREHPEIAAAEYAELQAVVNLATAKVLDGNSLIYVREPATEVAAGYVLVVKATREKGELFITSFRRLSRLEAQRDAEVARLLRKGRKG